MAVVVNYRAVRRSFRMLGTAIGSALIGFIQGGTGAVARTAQNKMRERVSIDDFGAAGDGTTDDSAAMSAALTYLDSVGGGALYFGPKTYRIDSTVIPVLTAGSVQTMKPLYLVGSGNHWSGNGLPVNGGTVLDLRGGNANGKIQLNGSGMFSAEGITFTNLGTADTYPIIKTTNATLHIRRCAFIGHSSKSGTTCDQDAIHLGGTLTPNGNDPDSPFQGYGTIIEGNFFNRIRRLVYMQNWCNGSIVRSNTAWTTCGSNLVGGAAIEINGDPGGSNTNVGNIIDGNLLEMGFYPYGIKVTRAGQNIISGNGGYDPTGVTLAMVRLEATSSNNLVVTSFGPPGSYVSDAGTGNRILSISDDATKLRALDVTGGLTTVDVTMQPTTVGVNGIAPVGTLSNGVLWYLKSGTTDSNPDAAGFRHRWHGDGSYTNNGNGAGNVTGSYVTWSGNGKKWRADGASASSGGTMEIFTGSGGSNFDMKTFAFRWYDHTETLRATWKPSGSGVESDSDFVFNTAGKGIRLKEGSNAKLGVATLAAGAVTVNTTAVTANSRIFLTRATTGGTTGDLSYTISAGASFTINSVSGTETSTVNWMIVEPSP